MQRAAEQRASNVVVLEKYRSRMYVSLFCAFCLCEFAAVVKAAQSPKSARALRRLYSTGKHKQVDLAQRFGLGQSQVSAIVRRASWRHT